MSDRACVETEYDSQSNILTDEQCLEDVETIPFEGSGPN